ncbi:hypothetical protein HanRHA438_Chr09g0412561 [Helianthus annuus]|uniref:Uncharacterized protein n=1 Tax=Helianthus annuus TaxID=4232 RepID=A0A251U180_HELAN|nr:hypothetical protein HanXRQr2_Chr09g0400721 [Helianthus annuus]KAJ0526962.1 hypothetical protein HanHA300_Chr09g0328911 [Helianthus annuus]KAJ0535537.1 hypothetical protein HanIR_Chr09g0431681 [Helianthus annuus]KAJ0543356.1 hypothetical protein HanHA89_Chr09g0349801 [Helianthus annuus]KAJ0708413.1 hypothetical protein HanLR1_Chr09g0329141 [Helianthus annuus]
MDQTSPPTTPPAPPPSTTTAPTPLVVPKPFKHPEMYMSPTDSIMSPVSKGIFARTKSKKLSRQLRNTSTSKEQHKLQHSKFGALET